MSKLEIVNVSKKYVDSESFAVKNFSLAACENEFIVIVGPSGCGKTTLLRMIAGLEEPSSGQILLDGGDISFEKPYKRNIAMVFQSYALYPHKSVYNNLAYPLKVRKMTKKEIRSRVLEVADKLDVSDCLRKKPAMLSGGQQQRVAIGRAIIREPEVFLFDEPLANLDVTLKEKTREEFAKLHVNTNATFVYVTHDQNEAMTLADRIVVMSNGTIQQIGTPYEVYNNPSNLFVAAFFGVPKINVVSKEVCSQLLNTTDIELDEEMIFAVRPENIRFTHDNSFCRGVINRVELLGKDIIYYININDSEIRVCSSNSQRITQEKGDEVYCRIDISDLKTFDRSTGNLIVR